MVARILRQSLPKPNEEEFMLIFRKISPDKKIKRKSKNLKSKQYLEMMKNDDDVPLV